MRQWWILKVDIGCQWLPQAWTCMHFIYGSGQHNIIVRYQPCRHDACSKAYIAIHASIVKVEDSHVATLLSTIYLYHRSFCAQLRKQSRAIVPLLIPRGQPAHDHMQLFYTTQFALSAILTVYRLRGAGQQQYNSSQHHREHSRSHCRTVNKGIIPTASSYIKQPLVRFSATIISPRHRM